MGILRARLAERKLTLELTTTAKEALAAEGCSLDYGARPLARAIQKRGQHLLALTSLAGDIREARHIRIDASATGELIFEA